MRPFLKWAGGKTRVVERIKAVLPQGERLVEPFVGSGALFLNVEFPAYLLADAN
ncbi:MAG: DNA adenine methylase, partial [Caldilinea sp.]